MRTVTLQEDVFDPHGLYFDLIRAEFEVESVAIEKGRTTIHLADEEEKDPLPVADLWVGREPVRLSRSALLERRDIQKNFIAQKPSRLAVLRTKFQAQPVDSYMEDAGGVQVLAMEPAQKDSWWNKLRKLW